MSNSKLQFTVNVLFRIFTSLFIIGALFKIMHWPYAELIMISSGVLASVFYLVRFSLKKPKSLLDFVKLIFVLLVFLSPEKLIPIEVNQLVGFSIKQVISVLKLVTFVYIVIQDSSSILPTNNSGFISQILFSISGFVVILGGLFKVMHWPGAGTLLVCGLLFLALWSALSPFLKKRIISNADHSDTLDAQFTSEKPEKKRFKSTPLGKNEKNISILTVILMALGLILFAADHPLAKGVIVGGFICGGIFLISTFRSD